MRAGDDVVDEAVLEGFLGGEPPVAVGIGLDALDGLAGELGVEPEHFALDERELLGLDGIGTDRHACDAVALEDSTVCVIPYGQLEELSLEITDLQRVFHKIMSREIVREHGVMLLLGSMRAEERLAAFLLNLTQRLHLRGYSRSALVLRMSREEIGSYLGLKLETVSRTFSRFQAEGILEVKQRDIRIVDHEGLRKLVNSTTC